MSENKKKLNDIEYLHKLKDNDKLFFDRVYSDGIDKYIDRLKAIDFLGKQKVLDAGCGFGQWSFALSELNHSVEAFDFSSKRVEVCNGLNEVYAKNNISFQKADLEKIPFPDNHFDLVFCYSTIFITNPEVSFNELFRILKKGGRLYINMNDLGWYLHNLENKVNDAQDYSSKEMAIDAIENSFNFFLFGKKEPGKQIVMPVDYTINLMRKVGFINIKWDGEGLINLNNKINVNPFFKKTYNNKIGVYEVLGEK